MSDRLTDQQMCDLADDAFTALNWTKRQGFDKQRQIDELVHTFEVRLGYREARK